MSLLRVTGPLSSIHRHQVAWSATTRRIEDAKPPTIEDSGDYVSQHGMRFSFNNKALKQYGPQGATDASARGVHELLRLDADGKQTIGPRDPHFITRIRLPWMANPKHTYIHGYRLANLGAPTLAARGVLATAIGTGTKTLTTVGTDTSIRIGTGAVSGGGYLLEMNHSTQSLSSQQMFYMKFAIPTALQLILKAGVWDGTLNNAVYFGREETGTAANFRFGGELGGVWLPISLGIGNDASIYELVIAREDGAATAALYVAVDGGNFTLVAEATANLPTAATLWPFVYFVSQSTSARSLDIYTIYTICLM